MEIAFQQSLFGKTSSELGYLETGWIISPYCERSRAPKFQCLLLDSGQMPEWCEGDDVISPGASWTPNIGQTPELRAGKESFSWQILEGGVLPKYCLSPGQCTHFLRLAERAGCPPPAEIEALFLKQGGEYPSSDPFKDSVCGEPQKADSTPRSETALDYQLTLFPPCWLEQ